MLLVVEDERNARAVLGEALRGDGRAVRLAASAAEASQIVEREPVDLVLTDVVMPGTDGIEFLRWVKERRPETIVIVMTAYGSIERAVGAMRDGAYDFIEKPIDLKALRERVDEALGRRATAREAEIARRRHVTEGFGEIVGRSEKMQEVLRIVRKVAPTNATVLLLGESGTGKELIADAIHRESHRVRGPLVKVHCASLTETLLASELFGHEKGAFTGAIRTKKGRFELADGGTLFLDEIGEIPGNIQVSLLRAIQNREIERVGGTETLRVDVRLVAATNSDLEEKVRRGEFREDFYYRIKVITLRVPPLRERMEDLPPLVEHFIRKANQKNRKSVKCISREATRLLEAHAFPGNVRELENLIEAAVVLADGDEITPDLLPVDLGGARPVVRGDVVQIPVGTSIDRAERTLILETLKRAGGNKTQAARILKIGLRTLYRKLKEYGLGSDVPDPDA